VSLTSVVGKLLEKIIREHIIKHESQWIIFKQTIRIYIRKVYINAATW
jgi:hypothetical protein